jgi:hypothetical protein
LQYRDDARLRAALPLIQQAVQVGPVRRPGKDLIVDEVV